MYIGVVSANYPRVLLDSYSVEQPIGTGNLSRGPMIGQRAGEKFAKMTPVKNVIGVIFGLTASKR
jgi:hypothetical protein